MRSAPDSIHLDRQNGIVTFKGKIARLKAGKSLYTSLYMTRIGDIFILEVHPQGYVTAQLIDKNTMQTIKTFFDQNPDDFTYKGDRLKKSFYDYSESRQADIVCDLMGKCQEV